MLIKNLEKKIKVKHEENMISTLSIFELEYYLLESRITSDDELNGKKTFGIEIVKKLDGGKVERRSIMNFSCNIETVRDLITRLAYNSVTPVGLPDIIDDLIGA